MTAIARRRVLIVTRRAEALAALAATLRDSGYTVEVRAESPNTVAADLALIDVADEGWSAVDDPADGRLVLLVADVPSMQRGFALGADDCVLDSADPGEVAARCEAILRRTTDAPTRGEPSVFVDRRLWINFDSRQVWVRGQPVHLTPREFRLLRYLVRNRGNTLTHEQILEAVWGRADRGDRPTEVLKQYIWRLRQKLEPDPNAPDTIVTDSGEGYRFVAHSP